MSHTATSSRGHWKQRALSLLMTAALLIGMAPGLALPAAADESHWATPYLDQMVEWGFMRADQAAKPDEPLTRAEFMAIVNRAYGYNETGSIPFEDVATTDWFYDDVCIAYTAKYIAGTSETTASPNMPLNRETVVFIMGKNMMMEEKPGESLAFSDSRETSDWARGMVKAAVDNYMVTGFNNQFRPKDSMSRGEMAVLVTQCVGTPIQESGDYSLGDTFGNVTITSPGVTLRDTVIAGDLYISGGVGLGDIKLENVTVLGRIVASGTGQSEEGDASIVMRNVTADEMLVDNLRNQYVTIRAEGLTQIEKTLVRTPTYLEDNTPADAGLKQIVLEGSEPGTQLDLAGRIKEVTTKVPESIVKVAKGTVQKLTVDEAAIGAQVQIDRGAEVVELNLDVGTNVTGQGDIGKLNINAPGSTVTMLPDKIYIRPGLTGNVNGQEMDSAAAEEASREPKILSGYPLANDVAPTSFQAVFSANKKGTIYWAVSPITDGSVNADDLISPPSYGSIAVKNGSVATPSADTLVQAQVTGLTPGGSYYLSAVLVDDRGTRSPTKVIAFTTPDNSVPAFAEGYPYLSYITDTLAQVTVMPTKSCKLYYAVLPKGGQAPTEAELKSASVIGNLGYGVMSVVKNTELTFTVSNQLEELKDYVLYLWLVDADGMNKSAITNLSFTTKDMTPPEFTVPPENPADTKATSVTLPFTLNEDGTVYWVVVESGARYPLPNSQNNDDNEFDPVNNYYTAKLESNFAKIQVSSGQNGLKAGSANATGGNSGTLNISGLQAETAYDLYYVAKDKAGNFSKKVEKVTIYTLDENGPIVSQYFTEYSGRDNTVNPLATTDLVLEFSENIRSAAIQAGSSTDDLLSLYNESQQPDGEAALSDLVSALESSFVLYYLPDEDPHKRERVEIDYEQVTVTPGDNGHVIVTFPNESIEDGLIGGAHYCFELSNITDNSTGQNFMEPKRLDYENAGGTEHSLSDFFIVFSQINLKRTTLAPDDAPFYDGADNPSPVDFTFRLDPMSTNTENSMLFDLLMWTDSQIQFDLYYRVLDQQGKPVPAYKDGALATNEDGKPYYFYNDISGTIKDKPTQTSPNTGADGNAITLSNGWYYMNNSGQLAPDKGTKQGISVGRDFVGCSDAIYPALNKLISDGSVYYEFAIVITQYGDYPSRDTWNGTVNFDVYTVAGGGTGVHGLATSKTEQAREDSFKATRLNGGTDNIGRNILTGDPFLTMGQPFADTAIPTFASPTPELDAGDSYVDITVNLGNNRSGTIYYVVAPVGSVDTVAKVVDPISGDEVIKRNEALWDFIPQSGFDIDASGVDPNQPVEISSPTNLGVKGGLGTIPFGASGSIRHTGSGAIQEKPVTGLKANTKYYAYFVIQGESTQPSQVYIYEFETSSVTMPKLKLNDLGSGEVRVEAQVNSSVRYAYINEPSLLQLITDDFKANGFVSTKYNDPTPDDPFTVFDAMNTDYKSSNHDNTAVDADGNPIPAPSFQDGYSVFDAYASDDLKTRVANYIRQTGGEAIRNQANPMTGSGSNWQVTIPQPGDLEEMEYGQDYYVLVVAYNVASSQGVGDTFRAIKDVEKVDRVPPQPDQLMAQGRLNANNDTVTGSLQIRFDKEVYWVPSEGSSDLYSVVGGTDDYDSTEGTVGIQSISDPSMGTLTSTGQGTTFTLNFTRAPKNGFITLFTTGRIANKSGYSQEMSVSIQLEWRDGGSNQSGLQVGNVVATATWNYPKNTSHSLDSTKK